MLTFGTQPRENRKFINRFKDPVTPVLVLTPYSPDEADCQWGWFREHSYKLPTDSGYTWFFGPCLGTGCTICEELPDASSAQRYLFAAVSDLQNSSWQLWKFSYPLKKSFDQASQFGIDINSVTLDVCQSKNGAKRTDWSVKPSETKLEAPDDFDPPDLNDALAEEYEYACNRLKFLRNPTPTFGGGQDIPFDRKAVDLEEMAVDYWPRERMLSYLAEHGVEVIKPIRRAELVNKVINQQRLLEVIAEKAVKAKKKG